MIKEGSYKRNIESLQLPIEISDWNQFSEISFECQMQFISVAFPITFYSALQFKGFILNSGKPILLTILEIQ